MLTYSAVPREYKTVNESEAIYRIKEHKRNLGKKMVILTHHYQRKELVPLGDYTGDSYYLSKVAASEKEAQHIVFCGVHFMAESARILCRPEQIVYLPNPLAGCPMADMAEIDDVLSSWKELKSILSDSKVIPISYMNSAASLKAFCGENDGVVCTSSNAHKAFEWGFKRGQKIFFFPDEHLGKNSCNRLKIPADEIIIWDPKKELGGNEIEKIRNAKVILWKGYCHVHINFTPEHVKKIREQYANALVVVHPECSEETVALADASGSTNFIVKYVTEAPSGSVIAIGTEINLISRLADMFPDKKILELTGQTCPMCVNMFRTTLGDLLYTLDTLGKVNIIEVDPEIKKGALLALERMLELN